MSESQFFIKPGYRINQHPENYQSSPDDDRIYQEDVYRFASKVAQEQPCSAVVDVGCGLGQKLVQFVLPHVESIVGLDTSATVSRCREMHDVGTWLEVDLSADPPAAWSRRFDLIICADVIEHLVDPDVVLRWIRLFSKPTSRIVLSTPERDLRRGRRSLGPPENLGHVREWNSREFCAYLDSRGFDILQHEIVDLKRGVKTCQLALLAP